MQPLAPPAPAHLACDEAADARGDDGRLGAPREHQVCLASPDVVGGAAGGGAQQARAAPDVAHTETAAAQTCRAEWRGWRAVPLRSMPPGPARLGGDAFLNPLGGQACPACLWLAAGGETRRAACPVCLVHHAVALSTQPGAEPPARRAGLSQPHLRLGVPGAKRAACLRMQ